MSYETPQVSAELLNTAFVQKIEQGLVKEAELAASAYIRTQLYEEGFLRRLFEPQTVTSDELDPELNSDKPSVIREIEPDAPSATFVPFKGTGDRQYFEGKRYRVPFGKIESTRENKSKFELMSTRMDIMSWLKDKQVKKIQEQEDGLFIETVNDIVSNNASAQSVAAGSISFKDAFSLGLKGLTSLRLPVGKVLMHKNTYTDSLKLKTDEIGYAPQEKRFNEGVENEDSFLNVPVVTTIKDDLIPEGKLFFFAPQEYFCDFLMIQDATLFLKMEADMIEFHTYEAPGFGVGNTLGCFVVEL